MTVEKTKYSLSIDGVQSVAGGLNKVEGGFGKVGDKIRDVAESIASFTAIGGALSVGTFAAMIKSAIDAADGFSDLSKSTSISVENLSGLKVLAEQSGTTLERLAKSINKMTAEMGKDGDKFKQLGITAKEPIEAFKQMADLFVSIQDPQLRAAVATKAFGEQWEGIASTLSEGGARIGELIDQGRRLTGVTQEAADQADKFNDQMVVLQTSVGGLKMELAKELLPTLNNVLQEMQDGIRIAGGFGNALMTFAFSSPFGTAGEQVKKYREELDDLDKAIERYKRANSDTRAIEEARLKTLQQLQMAKARQLREIDYSTENQSAAEANRLGLNLPKPLTPDQKEIERRNARIRAALDGGKAVETQNKALKDQAKLIAELAGLTGSFSEDWDRLNMIYGAGKISIEELTKSQAVLLDKQPAIQKANQEEQKAREAILKLSDEMTVASKREVDSVEDQLKQQQQQNAEIGLTVVQVADLVAAKIELEAAADRELAANMRAAAGYAGPLHDAYLQYAADLERAAAAKDKLAGEKRAGALKETIADQAAKDVEEWKRVTGEIERSLTDALMRGFEGGKDAGRNFLDTIKNLFKTQAIKIGVETVMSGGGSALRGLMGGSVAGGDTVAAGGGNSLKGLQSAFSGALDSWGAKIGFRDPNFVGPMEPGMGAMTGSQAFGALGAGAGVGGMVGGAVGRATGSKGMGAATGALSGAAMGFQVGGPWGAAIGAVAGGLMGYLGSGGEKKGRNTAWADVSSQGMIGVKNGTGADGSNLAGARKIAEQYAQYTNALEILGGFGEIGKARFGIGSTKSDFFTIGGKQFTHSAHDKEGMMLRAVKEGVKKSEAMDSYVRKAVLSMNSTDDLGKLDSILSFAKTYRHQLAEMESARDPRAAQRATMSREAFEAADARRTELAGTLQQARESGFDTTRLRNAMREQALADMGLTTAAKPLEGMALEMLKVQENAKSMKSVLAELGYSVEKQTALISAAINKGQADLRKDFMTGITDRILELTDASKFAEQQLKKEQDARLADAKALSLTAAQLKEVTRLNELERTAKLRAQADNLTGWLNGQRISDLSSLSPEGKFTEAQKQFGSLISQARGGDADALGKVTSAADVLLAAGRDQYASGKQYVALESMVRSQVNNLGVSLKLPGFDPAAQAAEQKRQTEELKKQTAELKALIVQSGASSTAVVAKLAAIEKRLAAIEDGGRLAKAA